jgi:hypothetical protein
MVEDLRFESAGGVVLPVKMPEYLTPIHSTRFWIGWQQENRTGNPAVGDRSSPTQGHGEARRKEPTKYLVA